MVPGPKCWASANEESARLGLSWAGQGLGHGGRGLWAIFPRGKGGAAVPGPRDPVSRGGGAPSGPAPEGAAPLSPAAIISSSSGSGGYGFRPSSVSGGYVASSSSCVSGVCSVRGGDGRGRGSSSDYKDTLAKGSSQSAPAKKASR